MLAAAAGAAGWHWRVPVGEWWKARHAVALGMGAPAPVPDAERYATLASEVERWRAELAGRHRAARTAEEKAAVERDARRILELALPEMMRCWLGTPWDFHGTAETPGDSGIACGYFVSTVLRDAGFKVDRYRLAQQPSENILRSFLKKNACTLSVGAPYDVFAANLATAAPGIYIVGLDTHVAFIVADGAGFRFIHSSGSRPWCVVDEGGDEAEVLRRSHWRMLGNLTASPDVIRRWLTGAEIAVRGA